MKSINERSIPPRPSFFLNPYFSNQIQSRTKSSTVIKKLNVIKTKSPRIMCIGVEKRHDECGHVQTYEFHSRCTNALQTNRICPNSECVFIKEAVYEPSLCPECYGKAEKKLRDGADSEFEDFTVYADKVKRELENPLMDSSLRNAMQLLLIETDRLRDTSREARKRALAEFRASQGVNELFVPE